MSLSQRLTGLSIILAALAPAACQPATQEADKMTTQTSMLKLADGSDTPLLTLKNDQLSVQFVPELGGKIISIKDADGREFLSRSDRPYARRQYGMEFGKTEFDGIDECFPSMGACKYPYDGAYKDVDMVDHGEVFNMPWTVLSGAGVDMECKGTRFQYVFRRTATLEGNVLKLDYTVTNTGSEPLHWMYLFHPLLAADKGTGLTNIPDDMPIKISYNPGDFLGKRFDIKPWGQLKDAEGKPFKDDQFRPKSERYYKYHSPKLDKAELVLSHADGSAVKMTWSKDILPFFAVWTSEGSVGGLHHFAPEPSNSSTDNLATAKEAGEESVIPPGGTIKWFINIEITPAKK